MSNPPPPAPSRLATPSARVLGLRVDAIDPSEVLGRARGLMLGSRPAYLLTANALLAVEARSNPELAEACLSADLSIADSIGLVWAATRLRQPPVPRLPGIDLSIDLCREATRNGVSIFLLGAAPGVADVAADHLRKEIPDARIAGTHDGYFDSGEESAIARTIAESGARLVLIAFGSPRQELWFHRWRASLPAGLYVGVGGSFDVWSGRLRRAPAFLQKLGLEWLFRLIQEPSRYRRMIHLPAFAWRVESARRRGK